MIEVSGLLAAVRRHVRVAGRQGWLDVQMIVAVIALNLCGGERVEDLERLEADAGFAAVLRAVERRLLVRRERRRMKSRFRRGRERAVPSPSALSGKIVLPSHGQSGSHSIACNANISGRYVAMASTYTRKASWRTFHASSQALSGALSHAL